MASEEIYLVVKGKVLIKYRSYSMKKTDFNYTYMLSEGSVFSITDDGIYIEFLKPSDKQSFFKKRRLMNSVFYAETVHIMQGSHMVRIVRSEVDSLMSFYKEYKASMDSYIELDLKVRQYKCRRDIYLLDKYNESVKSSYAMLSLADKKFKDMKAAYLDLMNNKYMYRKGIETDLFYDISRLSEPVNAEDDAELLNMGENDNVFSDVSWL